MCGIIAVLRRPATRAVPAGGPLLADLDAAWAALASGPTHLMEVAGRVAGVDRTLRGVPGVRALVGTKGLAEQIDERVQRFDRWILATEADLDAGRLGLDSARLEEVNASLVQLKDAVWAVGRDRLRTARAVAELAGPDAGQAALEGFTSVQMALSAIDRLEVRGRDSAGLNLLVTGHHLDLHSPAIEALLAERAADRLFTSMAVRTPDGHLSFVYKAAAEIGELGDNVRAIRQAITDDRLLHLALQADAAQVLVLGHTRWASVGIISQANAHPLNEEGDRLPGEDGPYVTAALNGDVDNYLDLRAAADLRIPPEITTDAKVIPMLVSRRMVAGLDAAEAFRQTVAGFDGSVAIAASMADTPDRLHLALRGSGQALYVGLAEDCYMVASEPYGLVEETHRYLRVDGETTAGQVVVLDRSEAGHATAIRRSSYAGERLPVGEEEVVTAEITTRDIDRAGFPHFLLKEMSEAPQSFRKTLRGKVVEVEGRLAVRLGDDTLPPGLRAKIHDGTIRRILAVGQGTAAVAGESLAAVLTRHLRGSGITVRATLATELSGFDMTDDMSDTLVVAISQSGTTTDTNRTVDLVRSRGATVVCIVNRRGSDLVDKSDGVLYTSDGRDVEMAVPSTKAFYAQVAAGFLLALALAEEAGCGREWEAHEILASLRLLPEAMDRVLAGREAIAAAALRYAPERRYWAIVGNGPNRIAASELRIKLSELCYKSIACDSTEDKKHIDLSSEPLILVCATGLDASTAGDVAKEVAIYRAHKAAPVVIATEGTVFPAALQTIEVPAVHPQLAFVLAAMAGHLFGYEAALAIDAQARPLREVRAAIEMVASSPTVVLDPLAELRPLAAAAGAPFLAGLRAGAYNGHLEAATAVRLVQLLGYASGSLPIEAYEAEYGKVGTPSAVIADLTDALTEGIDALTRPVDAIKHQAKTVTVGISRSEDALLGVPLVAETLASGAPRDRLSYRALRTLAALDPAVEEVVGWTRYQIEGSISDRTATIHVVDRGGVARDIPSRTDANPQLRGTKHRAAEEREVTVARGGRDQRTVIFVPEVKDNQPTGMTLLHVRFAERLPAETMRSVLSGYRNRYAAVVDAVTEVEPSFDESVLATLPVIDVLSVPVHVLAERWRSATG